MATGPNVVSHVEKFKVSHHVHDEVLVEIDQSQVATWVSTEVILGGGKEPVKSTYRYYAFVPATPGVAAVRRLVKKGRPKYEKFTLFHWSVPEENPELDYEQLPASQIPPAALALLQKTEIEDLKKKVHEYAKVANFGAVYGMPTNYTPIKPAGWDYIAAAAAWGNYVQKMNDFKETTQKTLSKLEIPVVADPCMPMNTIMAVTGTGKSAVKFDNVKMPASPFFKQLPKSTGKDYTKLEPDPLFLESAPTFIADPPYYSANLYPYLPYIKLDPIIPFPKTQSADLEYEAKYDKWLNYLKKDVTVTYNMTSVLLDGKKGDSGEDK